MSKSFHDMRRFDRSNAEYGGGSDQVVLRSHHRVPSARVQIAEQLADSLIPAFVVDGESDAPSETVREGAYTSETPVKMNIEHHSHAVLLNAEHVQRRYSRRWFGDPMIVDTFNEQANLRTAKAIQL